MGDEVTRNVMYSINSAKWHILTITGLTPDKTYKLVVFHSPGKTTASQTANGEAGEDYTGTVQGLSTNYVDAFDGVSGRHFWYHEVGADSSGQIEVINAVNDSVSGFQIVAADVVVDVLADANGDGAVDAADYIILKQKFGQGSNSGTEYGDFNDSGTTDYADLVILAGEISSSHRAGVPEPMTLRPAGLRSRSIRRRRS